MWKWGWNNDTWAHDTNLSLISSLSTPMVLGSFLLAPHHSYQTSVLALPTLSILNTVA